MTWRVIWQAGSPFPQHADYEHEPDARLRALAEERAGGTDVDVVEVGE
jgi:hypothetical protein